MKTEARVKSSWAAWTTALLLSSCANVALHLVYHTTSAALCMIQAFLLGVQWWKNRSGPLKCAARSTSFKNLKYNPTIILLCQSRDPRHIAMLNQQQRKSQRHKALSNNSQQTRKESVCRHYLSKRAVSRRKIRLKRAINSSSKPIKIFRRSKKRKPRLLSVAIRNRSLDATFLWSQRRRVLKGEQFLSLRIKLMS